MTKLSNLKPRISDFRGRFDTPQPRDEAQRSRVRRQDPMFKLYGTARWKKLRASVLLRDRYTCAKCGTLASGKGQAVVDHVKPHRRDPALFWDETNMQVLCKRCHDREKQREEQTEIKGVWYGHGVIPVCECKTDRRGRGRTSLASQPPPALATFADFFSCLIFFGAILEQNPEPAGGVFFSVWMQKKGEY